MVRRRIYTIADLEVNSSFIFAPDAFLALDYAGAPTLFQLEREIENNLHTNQDLEVGCPVCGNVDLFTREINTKGRRFRCGYCFYNTESEFETVKSQKDITLAKFGLLYECQICGEAIDSYNRGTVLRHIKKHQDENKVLESEGRAEELISLSEIKSLLRDLKEEDYDWQDVDWETDKPIPADNWDIEWEAEENIVYAVAVLQPENSKVSGVVHFADAESKMNLELGQQDPDDPNRMWGPDVISPIFPLKGYERPVEEVRADLKKNLVGHEIKMWHDSHDKGFSRDFGFSEPQPSGTWGKVTGVSDSNPNMPWVIGVWVTITQGGSPKHPKGSRVWFHVKDSHFPRSMSSGWYEGDYLKAEGIRECCECSTTEGLTTIQAGTFCWDCLPINLGAEDSECEVCRIPLSPEEKSLCNTCWKSYEQSLKPEKEWWAEDSTSPNKWEILNWIAKKRVLNESPVGCLECKSLKIEWDDDWEIITDEVAHREVVCNNCGCVWIEVWHYQDSQILRNGDHAHAAAAESQRFSAPYQPNQTLLDYSPYEMATSSAITGDFFTDSLKYGFGPESKSSENVR